MTTWKYNLESESPLLRESIRTSEETVSACKDILLNLSECLKSIEGKISEVEYHHWFEDIAFEVYEEIDELQEETVLYKYAEDVVNEILCRFYDSCDCCKIWIGV